MSSSTLDRRQFVSGAAAVCGLCLCPRFARGASSDTAETLIDPATLDYCGYSCPEKCEFREATLAGDAELQREAFTKWKLAERYGIEFDPETAVCYGCKVKPHQEGAVVSNCGVRACARRRSWSAASSATGSRPAIRISGSGSRISTPR